MAHEYDIGEHEAVGAYPYGYDLRRGAAAYAPIVGTIGGFTITGVVLIFGVAAQVKKGSHLPHAAMLGRASALLALGLIACLLAAFTLAAIGSERKLTPNLSAAILYTGVCTAIGIVAIVAAFEVLAATYIHQTRDLFAAITGATAIAATLLVSAVLSDAWISKPDRRHWLATPKRANRWAGLPPVQTTGQGLTFPVSLC